MGGSTKRLENLGFLICVGCIIVLLVIAVMLPIKSKGDIRVECMEEYPGDHLAEDACAKAICGELGLSPSNRGNWYNAILYCRSRSGGEMKVEVSNTNNTYCQEMSTQRINLRLCCDSRGAGYF